MLLPLMWGSVLDTLLQKDQCFTVRKWEEIIFSLSVTYLVLFGPAMHSRNECFWYCNWQV